MEPRQIRLDFMKREGVLKWSGEQTVDCFFFFSFFFFLLWFRWSPHRVAQRFAIYLAVSCQSFENLQSPKTAKVFIREYCDFRLSRPKQNSYHHNKAPLVITMAAYKMPPVIVLITKTIIFKGLRTSLTVIDTAVCVTNFLKSRI